MITCAEVRLLLNFVFYYPLLGDAVGACNYNLLHSGQLLEKLTFVSVLLNDETFIAARTTVVKNQ